VAAFPALYHSIQCALMRYVLSAHNFDAIFILMLVAGARGSLLPAQQNRGYECQVAGDLQDLYSRQW